MTTRRSLIAAAVASAVPAALEEAAGQMVANSVRKEAIAVIGTGRVGSGIGKHWLAAGHNVVFGSRAPSAAKAEELARSLGHKVTVATIREASAPAAVILLAVPYRVAQET